LVAALLGPGCGHSLSQEECDALRGNAFDIVNEAHTCDSDADCRASDWPGCSKPVSKKNSDRINEHKVKFTAGSCKEPQAACRPTPEIYCKQGLCVFREQTAGG